MIREELPALADELESCGPDCDECPAFEQAECRGYRECTENVARYCARRIREMAGHDACEDTTVSAYDLLSDEDRDAIAWVREHGGPDMAASRFESGEIAADMLWGKGHGRFWTTDEFEEEISKRLMPKGMEWPRYESGEPVRIGGVILTSDGAVTCEEFSLTICDSDGGVTTIPFGERVKRPQVLAADGEPLEVGQTVYATHYGYAKCTVLAIEWVVDGYLVEVENEGGHKFRQTPDELTHQRPVLDADGVPIREGDEVWEVRSHRRREIVGTHYRDYETGEPLILCDGDDAVPIPATCVTHAKPEPPDSWERIEEDTKLWPGEYAQGHPGWAEHDGRLSEFMALDLVRRCKALAERGER